MKGASIVLIFMMVIAVGSGCASTQPTTDPIAVIQAFHDALNSGDLDEAMSYVTDHAKFITDNVYIGKAEVRGFFQGEVDRNIHYELSGLKLERDIVTWNVQAISDLGGFETPAEALVQGGKIVSFTDL